MKFKTVDDLISDGIVNAEELDTGNPFIDVLVDVFGLEETDGSVADKTEIVYVDGQTNLGLTKRPQMLFGSLDVSEFEQETKYTHLYIFPRLAKQGINNYCCI